MEGDVEGRGQGEIVECFMQAIDFSFALWRLRQERLGWRVFDRGGRFSIVKLANSSQIRERRTRDISFADIAGENLTVLFLCKPSLWNIY